MTYYGLGTLYFSKMGRTEDGIQVLKMGTSRDPYNKRLFLGLATAYLTKGDLDSAEYNLQQVLLLDLDDSDAKENLATVDALRKKRVSRERIIRVFRDRKWDGVKLLGMFVIILLVISLFRTRFQ